MLLAYLRARLGREEGQALVEYALIAVVALAMITLAGHNVSNIFSTIANNLPG